MVLTTYVATATTAAVFGFLFGILFAAIGLVRRRRELDDREASLASAEIRPYRRQVAGTATSIVKPRDENTRGPAVDESPADPVPVYRFRSAEALAAGYAIIGRVMSSWRQSMTAEYDALATEARRDRDRASDVPASALIVRLRAEQLAGNDERRRILQDAVAATVMARQLEGSNT